MSKYTKSLALEILMVAGLILGIGFAMANSFTTPEIVHTVITSK